MSAMTFETDAYIQKIRSLDHQTLHELVSEYTAILRRAGLGMGFSSDQVDELVQSTWATFFDIAPRFEGRSKIKTFLFGIMYNKSRELRRDHKKHGHEEWDEFESRFNDTGHWVKRPTDPSVFAERAQSLVHLEECLEQLPLKQKEAFTLKEVQELTTEEVSEVMGVSANNLGVLSFRAKANLRECLEKK
tara:strand:+ start:1422 stop:1991 length:570 start_codon:yes stop_codon:yes gene_type:complete